jgi:hypothetical protein
VQRGERIIRRGRKPRENAEGHAYAEPYTLHSLRPRICVRFSESFFENHGSGLRGMDLVCLDTSPRRQMPLIRLPPPSPRKRGEGTDPQRPRPHQRRAWHVTSPRLRGEGRGRKQTLSKNKVDAVLRGLQPTRTARPSSSSLRCPPAPASPAHHRRQAAPADHSAGSCAPDRPPERSSPRLPAS